MIGLLKGEKVSTINSRTDDELDLASCNQKSVIVLGTDGVSNQRAVRLTTLSSHNRPVIYIL
jgi:hypothetical protein